MDGLIDFYAGGHLFINQGVDDQGVPHFKDMAAAWGLTSAVLRSAPPMGTRSATPFLTIIWSPTKARNFLIGTTMVASTCCCFAGTGARRHGARLFEFTGTSFVERTTGTDDADRYLHTCSQSATPAPILRSSTHRDPRAVPEVRRASTLTISIMTVWKMCWFPGTSVGSAIFRNTGCGFTEVSAGDLDGLPGGAGSMGLADLDGDGVIDVVYPNSTGTLPTMTIRPRLRDIRLRWRSSVPTVSTINLAV